MPIHQTDTSQTNRLYQEMEGPSVSWLVGKVLNTLSDELVAAYLASAELGLNSEKIKDDLIFAEGLLYEAQRCPVTNPRMPDLVHNLIAKANKAEDVLDELQYFVIKDQIVGTRYAVPVLGHGLCGLALHSLHVIPYIIRNCLKFFHCLPMQDDLLAFNRIAMSKKIMSAINEVNTASESVSNLLPHTDRATGIPSNNNTATYTLNRSPIGPFSSQDTLYGRRDIFEKTIKDITSGTYYSEPLYVLPIVGPGGIGKTTFAQHLYNDKRIEEYFDVRVWCVSSDFNVLKLSQEILSCIEGNNKANQVTNLGQIQTSIAQGLKTKRFLIVFDDIWECNGWKNLLAPFMNGEAKGSMVLVTTRLPSKADFVKTTDQISLKGLEPDDFFKLFEAFVFDEKVPGEYQPDLTDIARNIAKKLKGSPLAAETVGRLLKKNFSRDHWMRVLDSNEWQNQKNDDDIMPSLRISYHYLPFHLKKLFPYFSLFPEDYRFSNLEITCFWIAIGIIDKDEDYMEKLVDNGFLMKKNEYYVLHDLFHELSWSVSSQECVNIGSLSFSADDIPKSIHHLSITVVDIYDDNFRREMVKLKSRINIGNLRTLMIFREYQGQIVGILNEIFEEIRALRVLFIVMNSPESLPKGFSKLIHLRYLRIRTPYRTRFRQDLELNLPRALPIFYQLIFLDLEDWHGSYNLPKHISRLVNLRRFIANPKLHSNVPEVGKMEHLEDLKEFIVKKETVGFELEELGKLTDLGGELSVFDLEKVATKEEASKANLVLKKNLKSLELISCRKQLATNYDVVDGLQPHENLRKLSIVDYSGALGRPVWLYGDITIKHLESLTLKGTSGGTLPPFEQLRYLKILKLDDIAGVRIIGHDLSFTYLEEVEFNDMPDLEQWVVGPSCHQFQKLESIKCRYCPNFFTLPFLSECRCLVPCTQDTHYPTLFKFTISLCPKLSLPPMPHTSKLTVFGVDFRVPSSPFFPLMDISWMKVKNNNPFFTEETIGSSQINENHGSVSFEKKKLVLSSYTCPLAFHNMGEVESIEFSDVSEIPWKGLQKLPSLRELVVKDVSSKQSMALLSTLTSLTSITVQSCKEFTMDGFNPHITVNLKELTVRNFTRSDSIAADLLSEMARNKESLPAGSFHQLTRLEVDSISAVLVAPICSLLAATLRRLSFWCDGRVEGFSEEEENALQLLNSLQNLGFFWCRGLPSLPQGLDSLPSLSELEVSTCPGIRSLPRGALPTSLRSLIVRECSPELKEEVEKLKGTNPHLWVHVG